MRILLLGSSGQVGFELARSLAPLGEVRCARRDGGDVQIDLAQPKQIQALIAREAPEVIVNAAAYTAVDRAESESELAQRINGDAVAALAAAARATGALLVHYSTDYVFPGDATRPYREQDPVGPTGAYGRSKLAGEQALADSGCDHLLFRVGWVYAARGQNFLRTMLRLAGERERLSIVDDQRGAPTPARWIAAATALCLGRWRATDSAQRGALQGCFHLAPAGDTTWFEFATALLTGACERGLIARVPELLPIATQDYPTPARRPPWSVLDSARLREVHGLALPHWQRGADLVLDELAEARAGSIR